VVARAAALPRSVAMVRKAVGLLEVEAFLAVGRGAVLTTHRALFVEDAGGHGEAGELVEMPLAFIVETEVKRIKEGLVRLQVRFCGAKTFQDKPGRAFDATFFLLVS